MMKTLAPVIRQRFFDSNGDPLPGGKLFSYQAGTTTPLATYADASGGASNTNPVVLDANGECALYLGESSYKFVLTDASDVPQWTVDNVNGLIRDIADQLNTNGALAVANNLSDVPNKPLAVQNLGFIPASGVVKSIGTALTSSNVSLTSEVSGILPKANGGAGADMSSVTFPSSGTLGTVPASGPVRSSGSALTTGNLNVASEVTGTLALGNGGTGQTTSSAAFDALSPMTTLGDLIYEGTGPTGTRLAGNTTTTKKYLAQTGNGSISAAPVWSQPAFSEVSGTASLTTQVTGTLPIGNGGTGQTTAPNAINALLPTQTSNSGKFLTTNGTVASWGSPAGAGLAVRTVSSANDTMTTSDDVVLFSTGASTRTATLPAASTLAGKVLRIKKTDSGAGLVTVTRAGSDTIDGATTLTIYAQYDTLTLVSDGTATWMVLEFQIGGTTAITSSSGSAVAWPLAANTWGDLTSISVTPGVWDLSAWWTGFNTAALAGDSAVDIGITPNSGTSVTGLAYGTTWAGESHEVSAFWRKTLTLLGVRVTVSATTTYYLKAYSLYATNFQLYGYNLTARRAR